MIKKKEPINFADNLRTYLGFLMKYKGLFLFLLALIFIIDLSRVIDKFLFKVMIDQGTLFVAGSLSSPAFVKILLVILIVFAAFLLIKSLGKWMHLALINRLETRMMADLKRKYFNHILHLSHSFHTTHKTGSLISRLGRGSGSIERMTDFIVFNIVPLVFQLVLVSASLLYFDWISSLVVVIMAIAFVSYSLFIQHLQKEANLEANKAEDTEKGNISDIFTNIDSIKYFGKEANFRKKYEKLSDETRRTTERHWNYSRWFDAGHSLIIGIGTILLLYFPLVKFLRGELSLGTLVFIYTIYGNILDPLFGFVHGVRGYYRSMADFHDLFQYGKIENEIKDKPNAELLRIKEGAVAFKKVSFSYHKRRLFENFNLEIPKHKKIALVGHSGSGKSTLVKLLYRFYDLERGEILIDGRNIKDFKQESLRSELSIVPQECVLFDDTIYSNILFSSPSASREEVFKAMKFAQLDKIIAAFPYKEKTIVGERGVKLSGGEKQRVSIARALLANKKILVLDEATSSLDSETEHEIQKDLEKLMEGRTTIIIAHRLSTIMKADLIVVLEHGKIVQMGKHAELIKQAGQYRRLWNLQKGGYIK